jgi:hypothetical protein
VVALVLAACSTDGRSEAALSAVGIDDGSIVLVAGCFEEAGADAEARGGQIVVTSLWGRGRIDGECATEVPLDFRPGPDVVDVEAERRFALVGDNYRQIDYCGLETQRCVPFSTEPVSADCSQESLRFATVGLFAGIYPIEVVECEARWALVDIETCMGLHGEDGAYCSGGTERVLLVAESGRWATTAFEAEAFCPDPAESFGVEDLPDWVCNR